ncbi:MAG TPA: GNAT family N-acetyltransferase [Pyrinomonadaceae bacterium]|jgi:predicted GNAT superfamily acetyltransferase|nr:GNAT family N-acetyltransferase [Pyrinomonadaceae bacterium]
MSRQTETFERAGDDGEVSIRECTTIEEFDTCVRLQREVFHMPDLELSPRRHLIVSRLAGGWILGAYRAGGELVGFVHHLVAVRDAEIIGYSHMMAVSAAYQNRGLGARLKWAQRARALAEGRSFIRWTFEPMQARNAHFNINRLGVVIRSYSVNFYGWDAGTEATDRDGQQFNLDSDRLVAEWELRTPRVEARARGESSSHDSAPAVATVEIPPDWNTLRREDGRAAERELLRVRSEFQQHFAAGLVCAGFERGGARPCYLFFRES